MKTRSVLLTNLLELSLSKKSIIVTDPKAEIYRTTSSYFRSIDYVVKVFNLKDMKHSDRWNPLQEIEDENDIHTTAYTIISNTQRHNNGSDGFWPQNEENLLSAFEFYFLETMSTNNNLANVYKNITVSDIKEIDEIFKRLPENSQARRSYNTFASGSETIKASVITGLGTRLKMFQNEDLQKLTSSTDIDLELPAKKPCIYYVITSDMNSSYDFLASLFFTFLFTKLSRYCDSKDNGKGENDVFFLLDEMANLGEIPDFSKKISTVRSRGIALIPIFQNYGQLQNRYPDKKSDEILGNSDTRLGLGMTDVLTAQYFCSLMGVATVETTSIRKENSLEGELEEYGQKNISTLKRNLLNVDEILRIPPTKLLVSLRGNKPLLLDKMQYTEHTLFKKLHDSPISDYNPSWNKNIPSKTISESKIPQEKINKNKNENEKDNEKNIELDWSNF